MSPSGILTAMTAARAISAATVPSQAAADPTAKRTTSIARWCRSRGGVARGSFAFLLYTLLSIAVFALPVVGDLAHRCVGSCLSDTNLYTWSFAWMDHALRARTDPLFSDAVWAPFGVHLAWVTSMPGPAAVMQPVTNRFGALTSVNLLMIAAPATAAWGAYLVCVRVTRRFWPAVFGGLAFGFSTYMNQHQRAQLNLILVFFIPLAVYLVLRRLDGTLGRVAFVPLFAAVLVGQFSTSTEVFATATLMGVIAFVGALILAPSPLRRRLARVVPLLIGAYALAGLAVSPILVQLTQDGPEVEAFRAPSTNSVDLLSFVVPSPIARFGGTAFAGLSDRFPSYPQNDTAYIGVVFLAILVWFMVEMRRVWWSWLLLGTIVIAGMLALGPTIHIAGHPSISLPQGLLLRIPLIRYATADRLPLYLALALAIVVASWLAHERRARRWVRYALVALGVILLSIDLGTEPHYHGTLDVPPFFEDGTYRSFVQPGDVVLGIPAMLGGDMVWQAATDMDFRLGRAYVGPVHPLGPEALGLGMIVSGGHGPPANALRRFITGRNVRAVFAEEPVSDEIVALMDEVLATDPVSTDGIRVWVVPPEGPTAPGP